MPSPYRPYGSFPGLPALELVLVELPHPSELSKRLVREFAVVAQDCFDQKERVRANQTNFQRWVLR